MATTNKIKIGIDDQIIELSGEEKTNFLESLKEIKSEEQLKLEQELQAQKELKISAYKKLGLTDEEIAAII